MYFIKLIYRARTSFLSADIGIYVLQHLALFQLQSEMTVFKSRKKNKNNFDFDFVRKHASTYKNTRTRAGKSEYRINHTPTSECAVCEL